MDKFESTYLPKDGRGKTTRTLIPWRQGKHPTRNEGMGWFAKSLKGHAPHFPTWLVEISSSLRYLHYALGNSCDDLAMTVVTSLNCYNVGEVLNVVPITPNGKVMCPVLNVVVAMGNSSIMGDIVPPLI